MVFFQDYLRSREPTHEVGDDNSHAPMHRIPPPCTYPLDYLLLYVVLTLPQLLPLWLLHLHFLPLLLIGYMTPLPIAGQSMCMFTKLALLFPLLVLLRDFLELHVLVELNIVDQGFHG
jgi:hypothetical protein